MDEHREELATIESLDAGAVYTLALKTHVGMSIDTFRYYAGWCDKIQVGKLCVCTLWADGGGGGESWLLAYHHCLYQRA